MKVVFLDIDGVLEPYDADDRFYHLDDSLIDTLSKKYNTDYHKYGLFTVVAAYYDWNEQALARLKYILDETGAKIIISSDWRNEKLPNKMPDLLKLHNLDKYWYADNIINNNPVTNPLRRALEIKDSLERYPISEFLILDDMPGLDEYFPDNIVRTQNYISIDDMKKGIKILNRKLDK
ncbi:MAG: hypothetical protein IKI04_00080 [Bacilli bacterium]|nr:hypothetical protein [Bacilli bacterium]